MDDIARDALPTHQLLVIVCSTTGDGTTPDNMKATYRSLLRKSLPPTYLAGVRFAIFGLGDSSYAKYNATARRLWVRLQQLGATPLLTDPGLGDDQEQLGYDAALQPWSEALWTRLLFPDALPLPANVTPQREGLLPPRFKVENIDPPIYGAAAGDPMQTDDDDDGSEAADGGVYSSKRPYLAEVTSVTRVTPPDHFQDVRLVEIDLGDSGLAHPPGAVVSMMPRNLEGEAVAFCSVVGLDPEQWVRLVPTAEKWRAALPICCDTEGRTQLKELVCTHFDFQGFPRRPFFKQAAALATNDVEAQRLTFFSSSEGVRDGMIYAKTEQHSCLETLRDFPSLKKIPLDRLLELIPKLGPRHFSIASAVSAHPRKMQLLVAMVDYETKLGIQKKGVCTSYLASLAEKTGTVGCPRLPIWLSDGSLKLPKDPLAPVILVGPGTGVAPFRSFLEDRQVTRQGTPHGDAVLFFGCRNQGADFYFADQWEAMLADGTLSSLHTAFSRDGANKVYVQQRIKDAGAMLWPLLVWGGAARPAATVYVAGNATNMPAAVRRAFVSVVMKEGGLDDTAAEGFVRAMEKGGRYQTETWA